MLNILVAPSDKIAKAEKVAKAVVKYLKEQKVEYSVYFSLNYDSLVSDINELRDNGEFEFVVVGDDETINKFVNCFKDLSKIKFGIVPAGKSVDFAKSLNLEFNPNRAIKNILDKKIYNIDYLELNGRRVLNAIVIGASVETAIAYEQYKLKNFFSKKFAEMSHGEKFNGVDLRLTMKNEPPIDACMFELIIANGSYSDGKQVSPLSNLSDGLFNVSYSSAIDNKEKREFVHDEKNGKHIYNDDLVQIWTNNVKIFNEDKRIKALVDGEYGTFEEMNISLVENGLKIYK